MKNLKITISIIVFVFILCTALTTTVFAQTAINEGNFGFTCRNVLPTASVKTNTNMIVTEFHVFYVNTTDSKIYDIYYDQTYGWVPTTSPLGGANCPAVKTGTNIINYDGGQVFFVSAADSKIYTIKWNGTAWVYSIVNATQVPVVGNTIKLQIHPAWQGGWEIYYIGANSGTTGKICMIYCDGSLVPGPGAQLASTQTVDALATSPLVLGAGSCYYIGTTNKIYSVYWGTSSWIGGSAPLVSTSTAVRSLSNIVNEDTDPDHLYYVNTVSQICELVKINGTWNYFSNLTSTGVVAAGVDIVCSYGSIFYVSTSSTDVNKICRIRKVGTTWPSEKLNSTADAIKSTTQLHVWANDIFEETSATTTFKSYHVFYSGTDTKLNMFVYDDPICEWRNFCARDSCDADGDHNYFEDSTGYTYYGKDWNGTRCGFRCDSCLMKPKVWHWGKVPGYLNIDLLRANVMNRFNPTKHFFFIGTDSKIYDFTRTPFNRVLQYQMAGQTLSWHDEFNSGTTPIPPSHAWWVGDYVNPNGSYTEFYNSPSNVTVHDGTLDIVAKKENPAISKTQTFWLEGPNCYNPNTDNNTATFTCNYSSGIVTTRPKDNTVPGDTVRPKLQYGFIESRFKIPRGKGLWPTFFLFYGGTEDINFEFEGNGKMLLNTQYQPTWQPGLITYAVGYRFYDDYYTYAVDWPNPGPTQAVTPITFYLNNEIIGTQANININTGKANCINPHEVIYSLEIGSFNRALCSPELFPAHHSIDYIRAWDSNLTYRSSTGLSENEKTETFTIFPNPSQNNITIKGNSFSKAEIYNVQGQKVIESNLATINVEELSKGIYIVKITDLNKNVHNTKFIKE